MNKLEADGINLSFDGRSILSNIYLKCNTGDIVGILGRNGTGKSSLLKILFGTLRAENQSVRINGKFLQTPYSFSNEIKFVPQQGLFFDYFTFNDLVKIFNLESALGALLEIDEISNNRDLKFGQLSGGIKKFIEIITILYSKSKFVLLDEPFSFLSPVLIEKLIPHIKTQSNNKGIILTDHLYESVWSCTTENFILHNCSLLKLNNMRDLELYNYIGITNGN